METIDRTPTRPADYAVLSAIYALGTVGVAHVTRDHEEPIGPIEMVPMAAATFAVSRTLTKDKVEVWLRTPFVDETEPPGPHRRPRGTGLRYAIGELLSCPRCTGAWVALGVTALRLRAPRAGRLAITVGTVTALNDVGQAAFARLTR